MNKLVSPKITALTFGVLVIFFLAAFYVVAWQEPTSAPPEGNVSTPINVGTEPQAKAGRISATEFYDYNDPNYYLNPSGSSNLGGDLTVGGGIILGGEYRTSWPTMVDKFGGSTLVNYGYHNCDGYFVSNCPSGWTQSGLGYHRVEGCSSSLCYESRCPAFRTCFLCQ
jgi:hypothetical protein